MAISEIDAMVSAIEQFERKLEAAREEADEADRDLATIKDVRMRLHSVAVDLAREYERRCSAINKYNHEIKRIIRYGRKAIELAKSPLPAEAVNLPAVTSAMRGKKQVYAAVNAVATDAAKVEKPCGVYFLLEGKEIVYIGQSIDCQKRVGTHIKETAKQFDRACFVPVDRESLNEVEATLIALFKPRHNLRGVMAHADESLAIFNGQPLVGSIA